MGKSGIPLRHVKGNSKGMSSAATVMSWGKAAAAIRLLSCRLSAIWKPVSQSFPGCSVARTAVRPTTMKRLCSFLDSLLGGLCAIAILHVWRRRLGPWYNRKTGTLCRFYPSCSRYAILVLSRHGLLRGGALTINRIRRCRPENTESCIDFPP